MSAKSRRAIAVGAVFFLLVAGGLVALYLTNRREVTTSSAAAYEAYREGILNERRVYFKEARVGFARALALDPDFAMAMLGLARSAEKDQASCLIERARRLRGRLAEHERLHVDLQSAEVQGKRDEVLRLAGEIRKHYPDDIRAAMILARHENETGHTERALEIFSELLAVEPNNADAYNQIGYYYGYRGDYEKATENLKKYQFMAPDQANPYDSLGEIQAYSGRYREAIANLNRALAIKSDFFESYGHLGVAYEGEGDYGKAIEHYRKAAEQALTDGRRRDFFVQALRVAIEAGEPAAAREAAARLNAVPKDKYSEARQTLCQAAFDLIDGRPGQAEARLREARSALESLFSKEPSEAGHKFYEPAWNFLMARTKAAQGKDDEAILLYEEMANPPNPWRNFEERRWVYEGRACLAELLARKGDLDRAEKLIAENHRWNPSWAPSRPAELAVAQLRREKVLAAAR